MRFALQVSGPAAISEVRATLDGERVQPTLDTRSDLLWSVSFSKTLIAGPHEVNVEASDESGHTSQWMWQFEVLPRLTATVTPAPEVAGTPGPSTPTPRPRSNTSAAQPVTRPAHAAQAAAEDAGGQAGADGAGDNPGADQPAEAAPAPTEPPPPPPSPARVLPTVPPVPSHLQSPPQHSHKGSKQSSSDNQD